MNINPDLNTLSNLELNNIGSWPRPIKWMLIIFVALLLVAGSYLLFIADSYRELGKVRQQEVALRTEFEGKALLAANIEGYRTQQQQLAALVETQLKQLPNTNEVAGLLDDISFIAMDNGLTLKRINWEPEIVREFSIELPMRIEVIGTYHQLGKFTAGLAALPRIVILDSFALSRNNDETLTMSMLAKTYRYTGKPLNQSTGGNKS